MKYWYNYYLITENIVLIIILFLCNWNHFWYYYAKVKHSDLFLFIFPLNLLDEILWCRCRFLNSYRKKLSLVIYDLYFLLSSFLVFFIALSNTILFSFRPVKLTKWTRLPALNINVINSHNEVSHGTSTGETSGSNLHCVILIWVFPGSIIFKFPKNRQKGKYSTVI